MIKVLFIFYLKLDEHNYTFGQKCWGKNCIKVCDCFDLQQCIILLFKMSVLAFTDFGNTPVGIFLLQYGPVFSFTMVGKTFTYLLGSEAAALLFNSK